MICGGLSVGAALLLNSYLVNAFLAKGMAPAAASGLATLLNVCLLVGGVLMPELGEKGKLAQQTRERHLLLWCLQGRRGFDDPQPEPRILPPRACA